MPTPAAHARLDVLQGFGNQFAAVVLVLVLQWVSAEARQADVAAAQKTATSGPIVTGDLTTHDVKPMNPFLLVGVCPMPSDGHTWSVVWHFNAEGIDPLSAARVQKYLEGHDINTCLAKLIETDETTLEQANKLKPGVNRDDAIAATEAIYGRWQSLGVDKAILEVMGTGARGDEVAALLATCLSLSSAH